MENGERRSFLKVVVAGIVAAVAAPFAAFTRPGLFYMKSVRAGEPSAFNTRFMLLENGVCREVGAYAFGIENGVRVYHLNG